MWRAEIQKMKGKAQTENSQARLSESTALLEIENNITNGRTLVVRMALSHKQQQPARLAAHTC